MSMIQIAFLVLAAIASGGLLMTGLIAANKPIPGFLGPAHGLGALVGIGLLLAANLQDAMTPERAWWAFAVFSAGAAGGLIFFQLIFKNRAPLWAALAHGSVGAVGLYLLYGVAF
ncbi:MAG: hypothetical protein ACT4P0_06920 [Panacagrimonas sp.]